MSPHPIRLAPGVDLRRELERRVADGEIGPGFIVCGIGSIADAVIRFANDDAETLVAGPHEILTLSGSVTKDGAHLHASLSNGAGQVIGGHVCHGNVVRTTAEALLLETPEWTLHREMDPATGFKELVVIAHESR
ncbi:PPC domain-containing DNA-binding protein [Ideonella sp. A 288]|uniref:PPC domain-containing DNA-binding protein n=1 Tax=Ideonella sp. A 288 TaxID=1962181 RepID=UPI000B4B8F78|nr:PPC domain-containing DNA-binding protein [Ideonella sp. A 288]